jgi:hypothetical protein
VVYFGSVRTGVKTGKLQGKHEIRGLDIDSVEVELREML